MNNERILVDLARAVYWDKKRLSKYIELKYKTKKFQIIEELHRYGLVLVYNNQTYISFRGTDDFKDIIDDINIFPKYDKNYGWVHRGFYNSVVEIEDLVFNALAYLTAWDKNIHISGHSLGGAIASIMSVKLSRFGMNVKSVRTYGSPKPGKGEFKKIFNKFIKDSRHYEFPKDPVAKVPRSYMWWKQPGEVVELDYDKDETNILWLGEPAQHKIKNYWRKIHELNP